MNITISYKQSGVSEEELNSNLNYLRNNLNKLGFKNNYIYYLDEDSNLEASKINNIVLNNIKNSDIILGFINHDEKSEGQLLELGMAYSLGKKIILLINNEVRDSYYLSYGITENIFYFDNLLEFNISKIFQEK